MAKEKDSTTGHERAALIALVRGDVLAVVQKGRARCYEKSFCITDGATQATVRTVGVS